MEDRKDKYTGNELLSEIKKFYGDGLNIDNIKKKIKANEPSDMQNSESWMAKRRIAILDCVSRIDKKVKFSIGYSPQQNENHNNCGEHSFAQNALKDLLKKEKLLEFFPIIKYTEKQNETNIVFAFLIEVLIFLRRLRIDAYKQDTQKMFKLIEIIAEISILEQNSKILLQECKIDCDIVKELRNEIFNIIKNEFKKNKSDYSMDGIRGKLHNLFKEKIEAKLSEEEYKLESISEYKIMNSLNNLDSYEYKNDKNEIINKEELLEGKDSGFLFYPINQINREKGI